MAEPRDEWVSGIITYSGGAGGPVFGSGGGGGGESKTYSQSILIDGTLEAETKEICRAMGGTQPSESDWGMFFMRSDGPYGGVLTVVYDKMTAAHNVAKHLSRKSA